MDQQTTPSFYALTMMKLRVKVVDVGANPIDGSPPYAALLRAGNADIVGFEPNPNALAKLNHLKGPNEIASSLFGVGSDSQSRG